MKKSFYCEFHQKEESIEERTVVIDGVNEKFYCTEAVEELMDEGKIFLCPDCGQFFTRGMGTLVNEDMYEEKIICNDCLYNGSYYYCEGLDKWMEEYEYPSQLVDGDRYSEYYLEGEDCDGIHQCENCGEYHYEENMFYREFEGWYCDDCCPDEIASYHDYDDSFQYLRTEGEKNPLYLGVELEVDNEHTEWDTKELNEIARLVKDTMGKKIYEITEDGSLENGFEMVFNPMTHKYFDNSREKFNDLFKLLNDKFEDGIESAGLHVHVNRDYLGINEEEQEEVINKIYLIMENFKKEIVLFARRKNLHYCNFLMEGVDSPEDIKKSKLKNLSLEKIKNKYKGEKYLALNVLHEETIEFRIFNSTQDINNFYATLELVCNIVDIAKDKTVEELIGITWNDIISYKKYNTLDEVSKKYVGSTNTVLELYEDYLKKNYRKIIMHRSIAFDMKARVKNTQKKLIEQYTNKYIVQFRKIEDGYKLNGVYLTIDESLVSGNSFTRCYFPTIRLYSENNSDLPYTQYNIAANELTFLVDTNPLINLDPRKTFTKEEIMKEYPEEKSLFSLIDKENIEKNCKELLNIYGLEYKQYLDTLKRYLETSRFDTEIIDDYLQK